MKNWKKYRIHIAEHPINESRIRYKFVDCALNAGADCIVTNDKHFNVLKHIDFPRMNVVDIDSFKTLIAGL